MISNLLDRFFKNRDERRNIQEVHNELIRKQMLDVINNNKLLEFAPIQLRGDHFRIIRQINFN